MKIEIFPGPQPANQAAADFLVRWLSAPGTKTLMVAAGNTPLELYRLVAQRSLPLAHLNVFALDDYVGVPSDDPRTCANLLRRSVADAWKIPPHQFFTVSSVEEEAISSVKEHERRIASLGGLDVIVLGLGQNGHLGFNEPGSAPDSLGRLVKLESSSVEANRAWFGGEYAPSRGVTVGLKTILAAKRILILAYGKHKSEAVANMVNGPRSERCPASWLQDQPEVRVFLDEASAAQLKPDMGRHR